MIILPRQPQLDIVAQARHRRMQLIASMGIGKSGAGIMLVRQIADMQLGYWPGCMILAPLQVALNWRNEIKLFHPGASFRLLARGAKACETAMQQPAHYTIVTPESLPWLHDNVADWRSFANVMLCDESTRIKHTRAHFRTYASGKVVLRTDGSGTQMAALAKHATQFTYWFNMTATPIPNGLLDLWGQYWYIDAGARLGRLYSDYARNYFYVAPEDMKKERPPLKPMPGAAEKIHALLSDVTVFCHREAYYQLDEPNFIPRFVELPSTARRVYDQLRKDLKAELDAGGTVEAVSAGIKVQKLLQIASGAVYWEATDLDSAEHASLRQCEDLHDAKIQALESILVESGEPLVVVYQHRFMVEKLKAHFKDRLQVLGPSGAEQDAWNRGEVQILAVQYRRGSLGISLQHGGRSMVLVEPTYNAEHAGQILERLGPMRQMQSGYKRAVNYFLLIARGTEDQRVFNVATGKLAAQDAYRMIGHE